MQGTTRRQFLKASAGASAGMATWLGLGRAPAFAQKRELTFLSWNHFVPASDDELRKQAEAFGKQAGVTVRVDTIAHLQIPAKRAAEAQAQSGHDMILTGGADPFLFEKQHADVGDLIDELGKKYGGWYPITREGSLTASGWKAVPWFWVSFPATYNMTHFKKAGLEYPKTWDELLHHGKILKKQGNPVGIAISHCADANTTFWSVLWCYGGKVLEPDGKTVALKSDQTERVIEWYKELYRDAMEPEVLSWDDAGNNRCILAGKCSWIHNPISPYAAALAKSMPIADEINHHPSPARAPGSTTRSVPTSPPSRRACRSPTRSITTQAPAVRPASTARPASTRWPSGSSRRTSRWRRTSSSSSSRRRTTTPSSPAAARSTSRR